MKTTINISDVLSNRVSDRIKVSGESLTAFYTKAIVNQLENDGDFEIRDLVLEESKNGY